MQSQRIQKLWSFDNLQYEKSEVEESEKLIQAEYVWIGGSGLDLRSKTRTLESPINSVEDIPEWNYDGSSTGQAEGHDSEVWLRPVKFVPDPFRRRGHIVVLCETLEPSKMQPIPTNRRALAAKIFEDPKVKVEKTWYGIEQEYTMFDIDGITPLGWPKNGFPAPQGPYYCSVGANLAFGRPIVEAHYRACLYAGIRISGVNAEVMPGQWEFQVGPCEGIDASDQLWLARYFLQRVTEQFNVLVSFEPKPIRGDWNGAGCHTNYSTKAMRSDGGYEKIIAAIEKLGERHKEHMALYGRGNEQRMTGKHETARFDKFNYGVANRGASVRIPRIAKIEGKGYFEDRRPASNMDPYDVTSAIAYTTILYQGKRKSRSVEAADDQEEKNDA